MKNDRIGCLMKISVLLLAVFIIAGCFSRSKPVYMVEQYMLEYTPPVIEGLSDLSESIKVERFSANQSFNTRAMVYKPHPFKFTTYNYNRWRVNPADMVTDYFLRDLRNANIFRAVFSYHDIEKIRFVIEGHVQEFLEATDKNDLKTILSASIALLDMDRKEITERVIFQKQYKFQERVGEHTPEEFSKGMSVNMSRLSEQLIKDIHKAIMVMPCSVKPGQPVIKPDFPVKQGGK